MHVAHKHIASVIHAPSCRTHSHRKMTCGLHPVLCAVHDLSPCQESRAPSQTCLYCGCFTNTVLQNSTTSTLCALRAVLCPTFPPSPLLPRTSLPAILPARCAQRATILSTYVHQPAMLVFISAGWWTYPRVGGHRVLCLVEQAPRNRVGGTSPRLSPNHPPRRHHASEQCIIGGLKIRFARLETNDLRKVRF